MKLRVRSFHFRCLNINFISCRKFLIFDKMVKFILKYFWWADMILVWNKHNILDTGNERYTPVASFSTIKIQNRASDCKVTCIWIFWKTENIWSGGSNQMQISMKFHETWTTPVAAWTGLNQHPKVFRMMLEHHRSRFGVGSGRFGHGSGLVQPVGASEVLQRPDCRRQGHPGRFFIIYVKKSVIFFHQVWNIGFHNSFQHCS